MTDEGITSFVRFDLRITEGGGSEVRANASLIAINSGESCKIYPVGVALCILLLKHSAPSGKVQN